MYLRSARTVIGLTAFFAIALYGQLTRGSLTGTVADASGAVVPGVRVRATHTTTNVTRETSSNDAGVYRVPGMDPGIYLVEFSKDGFDSQKVSAVEIKTAQEVTINPELRVGSASTAVEVTDSVAGVELAKSSATIERTFQDKVFAKMPFLTPGANVRDLTQIALLAPTAARGTGSSGISVNGQRARNNNFMIDGIDNNDPAVTIAAIRVIPEAISEFQVQSSPYSAEFGRASGGQISMVTKTGTNSLHGEVFDYYRANVLDAMNLLNKRAGLTATPRYVNHQAGGSLSGPVIRDRTFFFGLIEANRFRQAPDARNATATVIPTAAGYEMLRNAPLGPDQPVESRQAILNSIRFLEKVYGWNPTFTNPRSVNVNGATIPMGTIQVPLASNANLWYAVGRVDHALSSRDTLNYRYLMDDRNQPNTASNLRFGEIFSGDGLTRRQNHMFSHTRTQSARLVNEIRYSVSLNSIIASEHDPKSSTVGIGGAFTFGGLTTFPNGRDQSQFQLQDTMTYTRGRHSLRFGGSVSRIKLFNEAAFDSKGTWAFDSLQDFLNNRATSLRIALDVASFDARQWMQAYFVQDDFKATRNLTFNLGLRYETFTMPFGAFGATDPVIRAAGVPGLARQDFNNWAPRVGFAYAPGGGRTVIRGGAGITYDYLFFNVHIVTAGNYPRVRTAVLDRPVNLYPRLQTGIAPGFDPRLFFGNAPENFPAPTANIWSLSIQRQLSRDYIAELGYTGNRSYHGFRQGEGNPGTLTEAQAAQVRATNNPAIIPGLPGITQADGGPPSRRVVPAWGSRVLAETTGKGEYHALFLKFDKRFSRGLLLGANYTWSANFSDSDEFLGVAGLSNLSPQIAQDYRNYRNEWSRSAFDRPQRFAIHWNYQVPWFTRGWTNSTVARHIFSGWQSSGFYDIQSGQPFTIITGVDTFGFGANGSARPDYNPGGAFTRDPVSGDLRTFRIPIDGSGIVTTQLNSVTRVPLANSRVQVGNLGRNTFRGPIFPNWNLSLGKKFTVTERFNVLFRADFVNAFNQRAFAPPVNIMSSLNFGENTSNPGSRSVLGVLKVQF